MIQWCYAIIRLSRKSVRVMIKLTFNKEIRPITNNKTKIWQKSINRSQILLANGKTYKFSFFHFPLFVKNFVQFSDFRKRLKHAQLKLAPAKRGLSLTICNTCFVKQSRHIRYVLNWNYHMKTTVIKMNIWAKQSALQKPWIVIVLPFAHIQILKNLFRVVNSVRNKDEKI